VNALRFSANLGSLWKDLPFLERISRAAAAGFDAVEFHDEAQREDPAALVDAVAASGLPVTCLNVRMGASLGCAAIPGRADQALRDLSDAVRVADLLGVPCIHLLGGRSDGEADRAQYLHVLRRALDSTDRTVLIEPISRTAIPGYWLHDIDEAAAIVEEVADARAKILFDCFHIRSEGKDVSAAFRRHASRIGHVQIAAYPDRSEPLPGALDYRLLLPDFVAAGYRGAFGCEYVPATETEAGLAWRKQFERLD
jgi:hydroxypyruvate isomerase